MNRAEHKARAGRIARDKGREEVRSALRFGADYGYYVFDELVTEGGGTLDYLAVGALGMCAIVVRGEKGAFIIDPYNHEWYLNGYPFDEDPRQQKDEMTNDLKARLCYARTLASEVPVSSIVCLTRAEIRGNGSDEPYRGVTELMTMPMVVFGQGDDKFTPEDIDALAREVERVYSRPPFVRPGEPYGGQTI